MAKRPYQPDPQREREIAAAAMCDPRSVRQFLRDGPASCRPTLRTRIERAMAALAAASEPTAAA